MEEEYLTSWLLNNDDLQILHEIKPILYDVAPLSTANHIEVQAIHLNDSTNYFDLFSDRMEKYFSIIPEMFIKFWAPIYWLPNGHTWKDVPVDYSKMDFIFPIFLAFPLLLLRFIIESQIGTYLDKVMQNVLKKSGNNTAKSTFWRNAVIKMAAIATSSPLERKKLLENIYRVIIYTVLSVYGIIVLHNRDWLYNINLSWANYPCHSVDLTLRWYYKIQTAFYISLSFSCVFDHRRSDFLPIVVHHIATICLLYFSWATNFVRIGSIIILLHDLSDLPLEYTKLLRNCKCKPAMVNAAFILFLLSWITTRLYYFPLIIISIITEAPQQFGLDYTSFAYSFVQAIGLKLMIVFLFVLLSLHIFWTYLILKVIYRSLITGEIDDVRSDNEEEVEKEIKPIKEKCTAIIRRNSCIQVLNNSHVPNHKETKINFDKIQFTSPRLFKLPIIIITDENKKSSIVFNKYAAKFKLYQQHQRFTELRQFKFNMRKRILNSRCVERDVDRQRG